MLHDERDYPEPFKFNPDRFLKDGKMTDYVRDPSTIAFGFGRRVCPGRFLVKETLWIAIASILATMDISKAVGEDGVTIEPNGEIQEGLLW